MLASAQAAVLQSLAMGLNKSLAANKAGKHYGDEQL
jgi:hypothetical protein